MKDINSKAIKIMKEGEYQEGYLSQSWTGHRKEHLKHRASGCKDKGGLCWRHRREIMLVRMWRTQEAQVCNEIEPHRDV